MFDLTGKKALVTGSSQGIGKEIAKALKDAGATVYAHGSKPSDKLNDAAEYIGTEKIVTGDISKPDIADILYEQTGDLDIVILNASIQTKKAWDEFTQDDFDFHINCNVRSSYFIIQKYVESMKKNKWGRIITIGSVNQHNNHPMLSMYGMTKVAQMKFVENIAPFVAEYGITINNIAPGAIATPRNDEALADAEFRAKVTASIPMGYIGNSKDMNGVVLLLCSDEGRYITGDDIIVDGGMRL